MYITSKNIERENEENTKGYEEVMTDGQVAANAHRK